jgi:hypothetical protein
VVVAVVAVNVMQTALDQVVGVITVWHGEVAAVGAVHMALVVPTAGVLALGGIGPADRNHVLGNLRALLMFKMAVCEVVNMSLVAHPNVPASGSVLMRLTWLGGWL